MSELSRVILCSWLACAAAAHAQQSADAVAVRSPVAAPMPLSAAPVGSGPGGVSTTAAVSPNLSPMNALATIGADYRIGPNDLIDVEVYGVPDLRRTVRLNATGLVSLPLVGQVSLAGLTAQQAEERLALLYGEKYLQNPQISVFIREFTTLRVTVEGAVGRPGIYPITGSISLLRLMALVGGGGAMSRLDEVTVFRKKTDGALETLVFDVEKIREGAAADPEIVAEDVVVVKRDPTRRLLRDSLLRDVIDSVNPFSVLVPGSRN